MNISWPWIERIWSARREVIEASALLLMALLIFFWPAVFGGGVLLPADLIFELDPLWRPLAPEGYAGPSNSLLADQVYQFHPWEVFARRSLAQGEPPLWNPHIDGGLPFVGNAQSATFSPFNLAGYLFPLHPSYVIIAILRLFVAGIFTFLLAREIGIRFPGALLSMMTFTFSGPMVVWLGHPHSFVIVWLPAMLFTTERALTRKSWAHVAIVGLIIGAQFLGGHPETSFHVILAWAAYALYRVISLEGWRPSRWLPQLVQIGVAALTGALLAAVQLLPFAEALLHSATLSARTAEAAASEVSFIPRFFFDWHAWPTAITTLLPQYFGTSLNDSYWFPYSNYVEQNAYVGVLPLVLAIVIILRNVNVNPHLSRKRNWILFFGSMALISLGVALRLPGLNAVNALPLFNLMANGRLRLVYALAMAILAGLGMDAIIGRGSRRFRRSTLHVLIILTLGSMILIAVTYAGFVIFKDDVIQSGRDFMEANWNTTPYLSRPLEYYYDLVEVRYQKKLALFRPDNVAMYVPTLIALAWIAIRLSERKMNTERITIWRWAILGLTILDLFVVGLPFNPTVAPQHVFPTPESLQFLSRDPSIYRVSGTDLTLYPNSGMLFGLYDVRGYDTIVPQRYADLVDRLEGHYRFHFHSLFRQAGSPLWDLLNVKYVLTDKELKGKWELAYQGQGNIKVYRNRDVLPRAFVVHRAEVVDNAAQSLERVLDSDFDFRRSVVLEEKPTRWTAPSEEAAAAAFARIVDYQPDYVKIEVQTPTDGLLVLTDTYAPGWQALLDGHPVPIYVADHAFRAVVVPAGAHAVEFTYRPLSFQIGAAITLLTVTAIVLVSITLRIRSRRDPR